MEPMASSLNSTLLDSEESDIIIIKSSDNIEFQVHRKNLEANAGAFPCAEFKTNNEAVQLSETGKTLELVFQFIYPRRHPTLEGLPFSLVADIAEAAEKYEIFAIMNIACIRLSGFLPCYAEQILAHAIKHDYPTLIDKAALCVARAPWYDMASTLPINAIKPWAKYQEAWDDVFAQASRKLSLMHGSDHCSASASKSKPGSTSFWICNNCYCCLKAWIFCLTKIGKGVSQLESAIIRPYLDSILSTGPKKKQSVFCTTCSSSCQHQKEIQSALQAAVKKVPAFTKFLSPMKANKLSKY